MRTSPIRARPLLCALALLSGAACASAGARHPAAASQPSDPGAPHPGTASDSRVARDASNERYGRIEELIEGRAPGVRVIRHQDGTFRLQIRGVTSPGGRNDPLIVIDGTASVDRRPGHALAGLNPADVLSIDVLKDAASTAFYGMRGANGVIVITTRQQ